jgi:ElaB/YqjD/DUF883 family membrane-anchored ribosome-binding protein
VREFGRVEPLIESGETRKAVQFRKKDMINPNGDEFMEDDPLAGSMQSGSEQAGIGTQGRMQQAVRKVSNAASDSWQHTKERAGLARERTEFFLRENPVPTVLGALALGLAIGLAIRYASSSEEKEVEVKSDLGMLSLPFLWPLFKTVKRKYDDSAEVVKEGMDRVKDIDVNRYVKPIRKRWKAWVD